MKKPKFDISSVIIFAIWFLLFLAGLGEASSPKGGLSLLAVCFMWAHIYLELMHDKK